MVKSADTVVSEFNQYVNMTAAELHDWLETVDSKHNCGYQKNEGNGETVGHESGRRIIEILKKNPDKDPPGYDGEDIEHMRKVVSYW